MTARFLIATLGLFASISFCSPGFSQGMPTELKQQIEKRLIGSWEFTTEFDGNTEKTNAVIKWSDGEDAIIEQGTNVDAGFTYTQLGGWDAPSKSFFFQVFTSRGDSGIATYDKLGADKWTGTGKGFWEGKNWSSKVSLEWTADGFRYEDVTEGKPFVVTGKKLKRSESEAALKAFTDFMKGTWTRTDDGFVREHVYDWTSDGKFMRSNGNKDPLPWDGMIGIDESNGRVGWWGFMTDGAVGVVHLMESEDGKWVFKGVDYGPDGPFHRTVMIKKLSANQIQGRVEDIIDGKTDVKFDLTWQRK